MINWFDMPAEGLSNGGLFEVKELEVTENGTYETKGEMYNKVTVNVEGGGGSSDFSTANVTFISVSNTYGADATTVDNDSIKHETYEVSPQNPVTVTVPLYKGKNIMPVTCIQGNDQSYMPTTEGSVVFDLDSFGYIVTGNGSITAKGRSIG